MPEPRRATRPASSPNVETTFFPTASAGRSGCRNTACSRRCARYKRVWSNDFDRQLRLFPYVRRDDPVAQHADAADLQLDHVAVLHEAAELVAAAAAHRARAEDLARMQRFLQRGVGDDAGKAVLHLAAVAVRPGFAVYARLHAQVLRV